MAKILDSLRSRIILIIFLSILPLLGMFIGTYLEQRRNEERHARDNVLRVAQQFSIYQEHQVNEAYHLLVTLAQFPALLELDRAGCSAKLAKIVERDPDITSAYTNLILADASGRLLGNARPLNGRPVIPDFPLFQRTLESKEFMAGELQTGKTPGKAVLNLGYPVLDRSGRIQAVLMASLNLDWFQDLATRMHLPAGSSICIIDNRGTIMARLREPEKWVGQNKPETEIIKTVLAQREGITESWGVDGNNRLYAFTPLAGLPKGGYVYVGMPTQAIYAQTYHQLMRNFMAVGGVASLALLLAWLLGYPFVMRRLNVLIGTAQRVAAGDLSARTGLAYREGEIDHLARSFDGMAQALQLREAQIIRQHDILSAINRIFRKALSAVSKEELGQTCLDEVMALTGSKYGFIAELNQARLETIAQVNPDHEAHKEPAADCPLLLRAMKRRGLIGKVLGEGRPFILNDPVVHIDKMGIREGLPPLTTFLVVPLSRGNRTIGVIGLVNKREGYDAQDQEAAETLGRATVQAFMGKLAEDKLTQFRREQELILASAWEGILGIDLQGNHTFVNPAAANMLGYEVEELLGLPTHSTWHHSKEDGSPYPEEECHILETLRGVICPNPIEEIFWRKDGTQFLVESNKNPIIKDGRVVGAVITFRDITARKQAEKALRESEEHFRTLSHQHELILSSASEGILGIDLQGNHTFVNPAASSMLGYQVEELLSLPTHSTWHHSQEDGSPYREEECHILKTMRGEICPNPSEEVFWRKDGTSFPVESNKSPIIHNGQIVGVVVTFTDISARKEAERVVRANGEYYRTLVETSPNAIISIDLNGRVIAANKRASRLTSYNVEEIINRKMADFVSLGDRAEVLKALQETLETGGIRNRIFTMCRKDGTTFLMEVSASLILDPQAQPKSIMAIFRDITERQRGEQALRESEEKYRLLVNQIPAVVYKAHADCNIDFFDNKVEALTGYAKEDFDTRKLKWKEMILPEDLPIAKQRFIEALKGNKAYVREYRIRRKDGEIRWIHNRGQIFCDASGKIDYVSGVLFDITNRKRAEDKLYRASRALRALGECNQALVHATEEPVFLHDVCRIIVELTGYRLAWVGVPLHDPGKTILPVAQVGRDGENAEWIRNSWAADDPRGRGPGGAAIRTGKTQVIRNILGNPTLAPWHEEVRRYGYNSVIVLPLTMEGAIIGILDIVSKEVDAFDSEEIKLLEELANNVSQGIATLRERAEHRQATQEKSRLEIQLLQAQKMEAVGTLAGGIAHDFNNILTAIVGYSELILMNLDKEQDLNLVESHMQGVLQAAERAKELVQQVLTISRKREQKTQPVHIDLIIKEVIKLMRASLPTTIEIRHSLNPQCGAVMADPTQIHQVIMNICTNAYHAMREEGGILELNLDPVEVDAELARAHPQLHEGSYLRLNVKDTGHGMEPEVVERIFEPYFTTKTLNEGTGLGLAVVHGIISSIGGAILVDSEINKGTAFHIYFPRFGQGEALVAATGEPVATSEGEEHILFVDDEPDIANITEEILKRLGYRVTVKTSSVEALALFKDHPDAFDLVITDQTMPQLTGLQLAQEIMRLRPGMPIIMCTGFSETVSAGEAKKSGIQEYLLKPLNVSELAKTVHRLLHPQGKTSPEGQLS